MEVKRTSEFDSWLDALRDGKAQQAIVKRIIRMQSGLLGDVAPVGGGVSEARIHHGPGYRLYFIQRGMEIIVLLCGGDKSSQRRDIREARALAEAIAADVTENSK